MSIEYLAHFPIPFVYLADKNKIRNNVTKQVWANDFVFTYTLGLCSKTHSR